VELVEVSQDVSPCYHVQVSHTLWCVGVWVAEESVEGFLSVGSFFGWAKVSDVV
jgi:hypothetical protein